MPRIWPRGRRSAARPGAQTAAGTGVVTRALVAALPPEVAIVATDLVQPMLDHAASRLPSGRVSWRQADAQTLPFPDELFAAVACQFGATVLLGQAQAFAEARRVLGPGGRFLLSVWDRIEENEFAHRGAGGRGAVPARSAAVPGAHAARAPRHGGSWRHSSEVLALLPSRSSGSRGKHGAECLAVAIGYRQGTPMRGEIEAQGEGALAAATRAAAEAIAARSAPGRSAVGSAPTS
ncbi:MAG: methyltransferase domain-containing protein [Geminicoccaceae bacterium]